MIQTNLGEIATIIAGQSPPGHTYNEVGEGLPFFQGKAEFGARHPRAVKWCTAPTKIAQPGDILISVRAPVGPTNVADAQCCIGRGLAAIRPDPEIADPAYVHWTLIAAKPSLEAKSNGSTFAAINRADLAALPLVLPPLDEQRRIVDLLDRAAGLKRLAEEAQAKARELIPALFLDMFGDPATNPRGWPVTHLGAAAKFVSGGTPSKKEPSFWGGTVPWVSAKDMKPDPITSSEDRLTDLALDTGRAKLIPPGSCLIVVRGMILAHTIPIRINAVPVVINQDLKALLPQKHLHPVYLRWALQCAHDHLLRQVTTAGHGTRKLDLEVLTGFPLPMPPSEAQAAFADQAKSILSAQELATRARAVAERTSAALMARLFAG